MPIITPSTDTYSGHYDIPHYYRHNHHHYRLCPENVSSLGFCPRPGDSHSCVDAISLHFSYDALLQRVTLINSISVSAPPLEMPDRHTGRLTVSQWFVKCGEMSEKAGDIYSIRVLWVVEGTISVITPSPTLSHYRNMVLSTFLRGWPNLCPKWPGNV